jgi:integrase
MTIRTPRLQRNPKTGAIMPPNRRTVTARSISRQAVFDYLADLADAKFNSGDYAKQVHTLYDPLASETGDTEEGREHRVPLSPRAAAILRQLEKLKAGAFVFPGQAHNKPLSNRSMEMILRRTTIGNATVHGFRSRFRDWVGNQTSCSRDLIETALAHVIGGEKAEQAYRRSDALGKRRKLMEVRGAYCSTQPEDKVLAFGS